MRFPRIQLLTIKALLDGKTIQRPRSSVTFKRAPKAEHRPTERQIELSGRECACETFQEEEGHMTRKHALSGLGLCSLLFVGILVSIPALTVAAGDQDGGITLRANHPAVGAWFGKAEETCTGDPATNCAGLELPAITLFMTPSFYADGNFLGNDSLAVGGAPFGPHTTAHGEWVPTGRNKIAADIVFMLPAPIAASVSAVHIKYAATVTSPGTMVGYVNIYIAFPPLPLTWQSTAQGEFPNLPSTVTDLVTPPDTVYTHQSQCTAPACPLVFKFKLLRVTASRPDTQ